jgi:hypothetical protein
MSGKSIKTLSLSSGIYIYHPASYFAAAFKNSYGEYEKVASIKGRDVLITYDTVEYFEPEEQNYYSFKIEENEALKNVIEFDENKDLKGQTLYIPAQFITTKLEIIDGNSREKNRKKSGKRKSGKRKSGRRKKKTPKRSPNNLLEMLQNLKI